jgi:glycosyltransferase involved in cell wall biosynthesis
MDKIRILFLTSADAENVNAQSLNSREIALRLNAERFEVTFFYWHKPDPRLLNQAHIKLLSLPARFKTLRFLKEMLSGHEIVAYMDFSPASYIFVHLPRVMRKQTRSVLHLEGPAHLDGTSKVFQSLYKAVLGRCDIWSAITEWVAREYTVTLNRQTDYILPVGVDCNFFKPPLEGLRKGHTVLFVGTLIKRKGVLDILDAAACFPDIKFRLIGVGRGGFERIMANKIAEMRLANVVLEGGKSQAAIVQAMRESDVFLLPSRIEGLPKVTLEAAATGLPCIVFHDYETPSVVDGVTGFQVATYEEMIQKLSLLLNDSMLRTRMSAAAREYAQGFDWSKVSLIWEKAYLDISGIRPN